MWHHPLLGPRCAYTYNGWRNMLSTFNQSGNKLARWYETKKMTVICRAGTAPPHKETSSPAGKQILYVAIAVTKFAWLGQHIEYLGHSGMLRYLILHSLQTIRVQRCAWPDLWGRFEISCVAMCHSQCHQMLNLSTKAQSKAVQKCLIWHGVEGWPYASF